MPNITEELEHGNEDRRIVEIMQSLVTALASVSWSTWSSKFACKHSGLKMKSVKTRTVPRVSLLATVPRTLETAQIVSLKNAKKHHEVRVGMVLLAASNVLGVPISYG